MDGEYGDRRRAEIKILFQWLPLPAGRQQRIVIEVKFFIINVCIREVS
jgi:hypothetical protein